MAAPRKSEEGSEFRVLDSVPEFGVEKQTRNLELGTRNLYSTILGGTAERNSRVLFPKSC